MDVDVKALRALLERAALPACEARLREAGPVPWPAWYVVPADATCLQFDERIAEVVWKGPGLWSDDATATATAARAHLFAVIPTALPELLDALERAEATLDNAGRQILNIGAARNAATERAERAERERAEDGESTRAAWRESERREQELRNRLIAAERDRGDLAATLETRAAEHALAMARVADLEAELGRLRWGVVANAGRTSRRRMARWGHVKHAVGFGSTRAIEMCVAAGFDPDDECGIVPDAEEDEDGEGEDGEGEDGEEVSRG